MAYAQLPIAFDHQDLVDDAVAYLIEQGWDPEGARNSVEGWLTEAFARLVERLGRAAAQTPDEAFRTFGVETLLFPTDPGAHATVDSTWTVRGTAGHTILEGTVVAVGAGQLQFRVTADVTIPPGSSATAAGEVPLEAVEPGTRYNGIPAGSATPIVTDAAILQVVTTATTSGGEDAQTVESYRNDLTADLRLLHRPPIREWEFPIAARRVAGVHRARAIGTYDASTSTTGAPGHVTVIAVDAAGNALSATTKTALEAELTDDDKRALNIVVHLLDPVLVAVAVDYTAITTDDADPVVVKSDADAVLAAFLAKATWAGGDQSPPVWEHRTDSGDSSDTVYLDDLREVLNAVPGLKRVTGLTLNTLAADLDLSSGGTILGPLPNATITGTVT